MKAYIAYNLQIIKWLKIKFFLDKNTYRVFQMLFSSLLISSGVFAQGDLLKELEQDSSFAPKEKYENSIFKATRLINGQSVRIQPKGVLQFGISHRFGKLNSGFSEFFGLDQATIRLGLEYSLTDNFTIGIGRSSLEKTYDGFFKWALMRQTTDNRMPLTVLLYASFAIDGREFSDPVLEDNFQFRLAYNYQLLLARKFSNRLSIQVMPTLIHRNLVATREEENLVYALGVGGRYKLTNRIAIVGEYYYTFSEEVANQFYNALAVGFDIETGGHVFQLHLTNSQGMIEKFFIPRTEGALAKGDIYFGFNISRVFNVGKSKK